MKPIDDIIDIGCRFYGLNRQLLLSQSREEKLVLTRFSIMKACRDEGYRLMAIARALGKDHGSVIHGLKVLTAEKAGLFWDDHERFLSVVKSNDNSPDPIAGILREVATRLEMVQVQIDKLDRTKNKLLEVRKMFEPENQKAAQTSGCE